MNPRLPLAGRDSDSPAVWRSNRISGRYAGWQAAWWGLLVVFSMLQVCSELFAAPPSESPLPWRGGGQRPTGWVSSARLSPRLSAKNSTLRISSAGVSARAASSETRRSAPPAVVSESWKPRLRDLASSISQFAARTEFGGLPPGIRVVRGSGFCGLHLAPGSARIRIGTWKEDVGLMGYWQGRIASQSRLVALMNGTFFYDGGPLGPVVTDGKPVRGIPVAAGRRSRCFLAQITGPATGRTHPPALPDPSAGGDQAALSELDGKKGEMNRLRQDGALPRDPSTGWRWVLGETGRKGGELVSRDFLRNADVFPMPEPGSRLEELLGGGGWIVRDGRDVHMEAYNRQGFRFRREDQDSRHSVAALDSGGGLFLLVFDTGANLSQISHLLRTDRKTFSLIRHAVFFDGGSSSALVLKGQYLVAPMYVLDRARFTAIEVLALPETR